jgi:hypothetical protein
MPDHQCSEGERIRKIEERLGNGDVTLTGIKKDMDAHGILLSTINKRLFIDNGTKSVQTRIDRIETFTKTIGWLASILTVATVGLIFRLIYEVITK